MNFQAFSLRAGAFRFSVGLNNSLFWLSKGHISIKPEDGLPTHVIDPEVVPLRLAVVNPADERLYSLTDLGRRMADFAPSPIHGKQAPPRLSAVAILNALSDASKTWLKSGTPLPDDSAAPLLERIGVIWPVSYRGMSGLFFTKEGEDVIRSWQQAAKGAVERARSLFTDNQRAVLSMATLDASAQSVSGIDRRTLRSLGPDGYNLIYQDSQGLHIRPNMRRLVEALTSSRPIDQAELFEMFPDEDKQWFMSGFTYGFGAGPGEFSISPRAELMRQMGWIKMPDRKRIRYSEAGDYIREKALQLSVAPIGDASYAADLGHEIDEMFGIDTGAAELPVEDDFDII